MMVDELHTEEDARMDELETRTRALAARCDAAEKRAAEAERQLSRVDLMERDRVKLIAGERDRLLSEVASLRSQLAEEKDLHLRAREEAFAAHAALAERTAQVEQVRGKAEALMLLADVAPTTAELSGVNSEWLAVRTPTSVWRAIRAALSPSPASATRTEAQWGERRSYVTDDRDEERRNVLTIAPGENGDWYVSVHPEGEGDYGRAVRLCTSGGAASAAPGLPVAIANAYRALAPSPASGVAEGESCAQCQGEGKIANSDEGEPWSAWSSLPPGSDVAVRLGLVKPIVCPACGGTGKDGGR